MEFSLCSSRIVFMGHTPYHIVRNSYMYIGTQGLSWLAAMRRSTCILTMCIITTLLCVCVSRSDDVMCVHSAYISGTVGHACQDRFTQCMHCRIENVLDVACTV